MNIDFMDFRRLDLNLVVVFLAIWQERSVTKAASRLALSQAATSAALARLRETCGDELFVRSKGGMEPTLRAVAMAEQLASGVTQLRDLLKSDHTFEPATALRSFTIGMSDDFEMAVGPALAHQILLNAPNISLVFRQTNRHTVEQMLNSRDIELAVVSGALDRAWLTQTALGDSGYACLVDATRLKIALPLSLDDYLRLPHVLVSFSGREGIVDSALKTCGKQRKVHTALTHFSALPAFLCSMDVIATLPVHAAAVLARTSSLAMCAVPVELGRYPVSLASRRENRSDPGLMWMKQKIQDAFDSVIKHVDRT